MKGIARFVFALVATSLLPSCGKGSGGGASSSAVSSEESSIVSSSLSSVDKAKLEDEAAFNKAMNLFGLNYTMKSTKGEVATQTMYHRDDGSYFLIYQDNDGDIYRAVICQERGGYDTFQADSYEAWMALSYADRNYCHDMDDLRYDGFDSDWMGVLEFLRDAKYSDFRYSSLSHKYIGTVRTDQIELWFEDGNLVKAYIDYGVAEMEATFTNHGTTQIPTGMISHLWY